MNGEIIRLCVRSSDAAFWEVVSRTLGAGFEVRTEARLTAEDLREHEGSCDVALLDLRAGEHSADPEAGLEMLDRILRMESPPPVVVLLEEDDRELYKRAMEAGAYDTLLGPPHIAELRLG